jgi:putative transferase (TIGR04331 family)
MDKYKRLFLSKIHDDFDKKHDIAIGPWCFLEREDEFQSWEELEFEVPFDSQDEVREAEKLISLWANHLITPLSEKLNIEQGLQFPRSSWRLLLLPWLYPLIQLSYERYVLLKKVIQKFGDIPLTIEVIEQEILWNFKDTLDFRYSGILDPEFNFWLLSGLLKKYCPNAWKLEPIEIRSPTMNQSQPAKQTWKQVLNRKFVSKFRCVQVYGFPHLLSFVASIYLSILPAKKKTNSLIERKMDASIDGQKNLNDILGIEQLIESTLPLCFRSIKVHLTKDPISIPKPGKIRVVGPIIYNNEIAKLRLAQQTAAGELLFLTQHGCNYGTSKFLWDATEIEYPQDAFISWGWDEQEDYEANTLPLPSPLLSRFANKHKEKNQELIMVGSPVSLLSHSMYRGPYGLQTINYRKNKIHFINHLSQKIVTNFLYRPYKNETRTFLKDRSYFEQHFPKIKMCEGDLHQQILACKLLILDHPGTTLNIALAANIPLIGFWDFEEWVMCSQALPFFKDLNAAGILFKNGDEAADHVNQIWNDVPGWWNQSKIQEARKKFCQKYARTSKLWWWDWAKALWKF